MRNAFRRGLAAAGLVLGAAAGARAADGTIKMYFDPTQCQGEIPCGETRRLYVYGELDGATAGGVTGFEFSVQIGTDGNADPGWLTAEEFAPGTTVSLGNGAFYPPDERAITPRRNRGRGVNVAWGTCQTGEDARILIETVDITNSGCTPAELRLLVVGHDLPSNQFYLCPLAVLCDAPLYTKVCLGVAPLPCTNPEGPRGEPSTCSVGGEAVINPAPNSQSPCRVTAVEQATWSALKHLYRN